MKLDDFEKPVRILVGLGFPREVRGVWDAHQLLSDWPAFTRNRSHHVALRACEAALRGDIDAETARAAFVAFARRNNLLLPDVDEAIAARRTRGTTFPGASA
jgi:Protein of unknown function (DUF982)